MVDEKDYYRMTVDECLDELDTSKKGLGRKEANRRLEKYGKNVLEAKIEVPTWLLFLSQFKELLVIILIIGGLIAYIIGDYRGGSIIFIIVLVNAIIGFVQEYRAGKIVDALKGLMRSSAKVIQDDELIEVSPEELVPGDVIRIEEGDKLPADVRLIKVSNLKVNEFALTGESVPQEKYVGPIDEEATLADRNNMAYSGTNVASGNATGIVVATGMESETGKIASMTQETGELQTPLQQELRDLARKLTAAVVIIGAGLFVAGLIQDFTITRSLIYALGVAMAIVPQALPAQVTVALSTGSSRLAEKKAVVKDLPSVETLGSTTVICTDKTGTLTKNEMTVRSIWFDGSEYKITGVGYKPEGDILDHDGKPLSQERIDEIEIMMDTSTQASNAEIHKPDDEHDHWYPIGDPTEAALITMSTKLGTRSPTEDKENPEIQEFSFDSDRKRMSSVRKVDDDLVLTVKGSTDSLLSISKYVYKDGESVPITDEDKEEIKKVNKKYSENGQRVLAIARKDLEPKDEYEMGEAEKDVTFLGLTAMIDPPKEGVKEAVTEAKKAGVRIFILTGDHSITAKAIGQEIGLAEEGLKVVTGRQLQKMSDEDISELVKTEEYLIFSRVDPKDKLKIVETLEEQGEIVAVTGDGVNDAPALQKAHIGVSMGKKGTDVAKEASRLVLLDDSFPTLVDAIEEGRTIYNNLKKTVYSTLTTNSAELTLVLFGLLAVAMWDLPIPILAVQILAIDLLGQIMPLTFLTYDPPTEGMMEKPPRDPHERMMDKRSGSEVMGLGVLVGVLAFVNFNLYMIRNRWISVEETELLPYPAVYLIATAVAYATIVFCQYVNTMERRYEFTSVFNRNFFTNRILLVSIGASIGLVLMAIYAPFIKDFLLFGPMGLIDWMYVGIAALIYLSVFEIMKVVKRWRKSGSRV
ncbi:MAG: cation-transporting P-type ATPase [Candidatus Saliniplasma sp.]